VPIAAEEDIQSQLNCTATWINPALASALSRRPEAPARLAEAMRYSLLAGGKRLRPALVLWCCELCDGTAEAALPAAVAVECVHAFSLIHDDLPALDGDDLRRGRPTNHKVFGEATAILAGDALLALAFEILANDVTDATIAAAMIRELAAAAGCRGLIGGEYEDLAGESVPPDAALVGRIHEGKTARLIEAACRLGGLAARADGQELETLARYGRALGAAFQATDDLLDACGRSDLLGKKTGKDAVAGKQTYVRAVGLDQARQIAQDAARCATEELASFGSSADRLRGLARYVLERSS